MPRRSPPPPLSSSSSSVYLSLKEEDGDGKEVESGPDDVLLAESYMTMAQSESCRLVDVSIQKNISFDGKPLTPTGWSGGMAEVFSLREQLKQAEEKASQVQREVSTTTPPGGRSQQALTDRADRKAFSIFCRLTVCQCIFPLIPLKLVFLFVTLRRVHTCSYFLQLGTL